MCNVLAYKGIGCDKGGDGVDVGAQRVSKCGPELADSNTALCVEGAFATFY